MLGWVLWRVLGVLWVLSPASGLHWSNVVALHAWIVVASAVSRLEVGLWIELLVVWLRTALVLGRFTNIAWLERLRWSIALLLWIKGLCVQPEAIGRVTVAATVLRRL